MKPDSLEAYASTFEMIISDTKLSPATIRNYHQKIHAILVFCKEHEITSFDYRVAEKYEAHLAQRVSNSEIGDKYAGFLKGLAYSFADFTSSPDGSYIFMSHRVFTSAMHTLQPKSKVLIDSYIEELEKTMLLPVSKGILT